MLDNNLYHALVVSTLLPALGGLSYFILLPKKEHDPHFLRRKGRPRD